MKVYVIAEYLGYDGWLEPVAVFSTLEKAEDFKKRKPTCTYDITELEMDEL